MHKTNDPNVQYSHISHWCFADHDQHRRLTVITIQRAEEDYFFGGKKKQTKSEKAY